MSVECMFSITHVSGGEGGGGGKGKEEEIQRRSSAFTNNPPAAACAAASCAARFPPPPPDPALLPREYVAFSATSAAPIATASSMLRCRPRASPLEPGARPNSAQTAARAA
jgi:hypothetical protein